MNITPVDRRQEPIVPVWLAKKKLNLGCGTDIRPDYVNADVAALPGVEVVHNLSQFPWPFPDNQFDEIIIHHVLEHLPNLIAVMEELWRICRKDGTVFARVPYWNSWHGVGDPTHARFFFQRTFDFFDPGKRSCQTRPYYSKARFHIAKMYYWFPLFRERGWMKVGNPVFKGILGFLSKYLCNIIWVMEAHLKAIK